MSAADFLMPSRIIVNGWTEAEKLMKHGNSRCVGLVSCIGNSPTLFYFLLASLTVLVSHIVMATMVILSYAYFIVEGMGVLVMLGLNGSRATAWAAQGGPGLIVSRFAQMMAMVLSIGTPLFEAVLLSGEPSIAQAVITAVVALILAVLTIKSEKIGQGIVGGTPGASSAPTAMALASGITSMLRLPSAPRTPQAPPQSSAPQPPPNRGGPPPAAGTGSGHGSNPFGPVSPPSGGSGGGRVAPSWQGYGPGGLGSDVGAMPAGMAAETIRSRAMMFYPPTVAARPYSKAETRTCWAWTSRAYRAPKPTQPSAPRWPGFRTTLTAAARKVFPAGKRGRTDMSAQPQRWLSPPHQEAEILRHTAGRLPPHQHHRAVQ
jgi:hypothetical protein